ncbi:MAG: hypothetical protein KAU95_02240, partial [Candidatus Aenigmarchaeota archaeon]|nr:hypothetical protein [Candidatus Aenigmarchaeota archaeon]
MNRLFVLVFGIFLTLLIFSMPAFAATCSQPVFVVDKDTRAVMGGVTIAAYPNVGDIERCTTTGWGRCSIPNLIQGDSYRLLVESMPASYECQYRVADCEHDVTACEGEKEFRLKAISPPPRPEPEPEVKPGRCGCADRTCDCPPPACDLLTETNYNNIIITWYYNDSTRDNWQWPYSTREKYANQRSLKEVD